MEILELTDELAEVLPHPGHRCRGTEKRRDDAGTVAVLFKLHRSENQTLSPGELRALLDVSGARVTAMLNELEAQGLVSRSPTAEDRRGVAVTLTEKGEQAVQERLQRRRERAACLIERIGRDDAETLLRLLSVLRELDRETEGKEAGICG